MAMIAGIVGTLLAPWEAYADSIMLDTTDEFTDERELMVVMLPEEGSSFERKHFTFYCREGTPMLGVGPGLMFHLEESVPVKIRFDQAPMEPATLFRWSGSMALRMNGGESLLHKATRSETVLVKVGDSKTMHFDLNAARVDILEFKKRCEQWDTPTD